MRAGFRLQRGPAFSHRHSHQIANHPGGLHRTSAGCQETIQKLQAGSRIADTQHGPLEYAVTGSGPAILVFHGASGGYEQAQLLSKLIDPGNFSLIGVSRPGYRQTPLSTGRAPAQQADAACKLLDLLDIQKTAVLGISAGGLAAIQLALRHPERCRGLILVSADMPPVQNHQVDGRGRLAACARP